MDKNGGGSVSLMELIKAKTTGATVDASFDIKRIVDILKVHDLNQDGEISFAEYCTVEESIANP